MGEFSISSVAQLVECPTLDLVDPVQMRSRDKYFFYFFLLKCYTFHPLVTEIFTINALDIIFDPKIGQKTRFSIFWVSALTQLSSYDWIHLVYGYLI